jgi:hypothetical protein
MNARLPLLVALTAALALTAAPVRAQYIYIDTDGDGLCDANDVLAPGANTLNVYLQTDANADFSPAVCQNSTGQVLSIFSYELVFHTSGTGSATYGAWTHNSTDLPSYNALRAPVQAGGDFTIFYGQSLGANAPGFYRLGSVVATVTGSPTIGLVKSSTAVGTQYSTSFGSECPGSLGLNTIFLGTDFTDVCGTAGGTPITNFTTWAAIKKQYR